MKRRQSKVRWPATRELRAAEMDSNGTSAVLTGHAVERTGA